MNGRSKLATVSILLCLCLIVLLQVQQIMQARRQCDQLDVLIERFQTAWTNRSSTLQTTPAADKAIRDGDEGDWLVWALTAEPGTLNPLTRRVISSEWIVWRNIFEGLLDYDYDDLRLKPVLAESCDVSKDGLRITFRLRDDIHFSDGTPVTADDVLFTYNTIIDPGVDAAQLANYYKDVEKVDKLDQRTVRFILKKPYFKSLEFMGLQDVGVLPKHIYQFDDPEQFNKMRSNPVGTGPYVLERWDVGRQIVLRRNENYWGPKPRLKKIVFKIITNEVAAVQALRAGDADFLRPLPEQFADMSADTEFKEQFRCLSYFTPKIPYFYIGWNNDSVYFHDKRVRLALTHLVDREAIIKYLLKGQAKITTGPFYIYGRQNNRDIKPWPYDPGKAKELLDAAGWVDTDGDGLRDKNGTPFRFNLMIRSEDPFYERMAKLINNALAGAGIEAVPDPYEWSIFIERLLDRKFEAEISGWGGVIEEDPYQVWHSSQGTGRGSNHVGFDNSEADEIIEKARQTLDEHERTKLYHRFHEIVHQQQPYTFLYTRPEMCFLDKRFENVKTHKLGLDWLQWYVPSHKQRYK